MIGTMNIHEIDSEELAIGHFKSQGFDVKIIAESDALRCDLLLEDGRNSYLIEVKKREPDEEIEKNIKEKGIYHHPEKSFGYDDRVREIVHKAVKQLRTTARTIEAEFKLVWYSVIDSFDNYPNYERAISTIFGLERIHYVNKVTGRGDVTKGCFYYQHSCFHAYKDLDAVILAHNKGCELLLNNFSPNYVAFRNTTLFKTFENDDAYVDPIEADPDKFIIADCDADRNDRAEIAKFLSEKYAIINVIPFALNEHTITFTNPDEELLEGYDLDT
jgi:hypothetical protein